ncbi:MAG: hypothetical protein IBJ03_06870 [Gemmatimonadaceae bacterium]|nr:hypothetical protein [Gemmatimonadaceae bacterium]
MSKTPQSFANHTQLTPYYHFFTSPITVIFLIWTIVRFVKAPGTETAYFLVGALALVGVVAVARLSPLRVQDRLIRLEEQQRFRRLLSPELVARAEAALRPRHYIALRFASDEELGALVERVVSNPSITPKEIKSSIRNWRADHFRV